MVNLQGCSLAGSSLTRERVKNDYYATPYESIKSLLEIEKFEGDFIEPCVGGGHIAEVLKEYYPTSEIIGVDLIDRGYKNTIISNYFDYKFNGNYNIITNPPYNLAQEFLEHSMEQIREGKKVAMFLKIRIGFVPSSHFISLIISFALSCIVIYPPTFSLCTIAGFRQDFPC